MIFTLPAPGLARVVGHDDAFIESPDAETCRTMRIQLKVSDYKSFTITTKNADGEEFKLCLPEEESPENTKLSEHRPSLKSKQRRRS